MLWEVGFQLSFAATLGLALLVGLIFPPAGLLLAYPAANGPQWLD